MRAVYLNELEAFLRFVDMPGKEPARLYVHGLTRSSTAALAHIAADPALWGHRSLLVDLLGYGYSDRPSGFDYGIESHAQTLVRLLDTLGLKGCQLFGHSMGGAIAALVADTRPDLVSSLVIAEANLDPGGAMAAPIAKQTEEQYVREGFAAECAAVRANAANGAVIPGIVLGQLERSAPHAVHRCAVSLMKGVQPTVRERFLRAKMPKAYVLGAKSAANEKIDDIRAAGIRVLEVPNAGHPMMYENPSGFAQVLAAAFKG